MSKLQRQVHRLLCLLCITLTFEGVARKIAPQSLGILIFFLKDFVTLILLVLCLKSKANPEAAALIRLMGTLAMLLLPCVALTALHDPLLAIFGLKQYALFPAIAIAVCVAYIPNGYREIFTLFRFFAFSVVATSCIAVAQNKLPAANWLNLSVAGEDLSGFSAGGYLRVSSTFSFVGQYCYYLNAICYCLPVFFFFSHGFQVRATTLQIVALTGLFIIGTFVTGSRAAVIGNAVILFAGALLAAVLAGAKALPKLIFLGVVGGILLVVMQAQYPEFFAAYQARATGTAEASHEAEIQNRVQNDLFGWTKGTAISPPTLFGYGLGVMSNGPEKFSAYAASWRGGFWTESDQATTLFEGGWYLVLVWNGLRLWVIIYSLKQVLKINDLEIRLAACFPLGFVIVMGVVGTLAIQPPLAIYWWLAVGIVTWLSYLDGRKMAMAANH
jgi:hypothetical protein